MRFADVQHQSSAIVRVQQALGSGRTPHATMFCGPDGVGREMVAERLATVLLCTDPTEGPALEDATGGPRTWRDACGRCQDCTLCRAGTHPDYHRIHRALNKHHPDKAVQRKKAIDLSVDVVRHFVIDRCGHRPARGRARVFVIVEAERMSPGAQNALLKTLEEPPEHSYLILLTPSADALLPTTRSRCQEVAFGRLPTQFVMEHLTAHRDLDPTGARFLAELAHGSLGAALRLADAGIPQRLPRIKELLDRAGEAPLAFGTGLSDLAKQLAKESKGAKDEAEDDAPDTNLARESQLSVLAVVSTILRDVQRVLVGHPPATFDGAADVASLAGRTSSGAIGRAVRAVADAEYQIRRSVNTGLIFDTLGIAVGRAFERKPVAR